MTTEKWQRVPATISKVTTFSNGQKNGATIDSLLIDSYQHFFPFDSELKILNCKYPQNLLYICASVEKTTRHLYYACSGLQWSNMFYAEFIAPPKPGIKYKKHLFWLSMNGKFMVKKQRTPPLRSLFHHCRGDRTRNAFWEFCPPFCLFSTQTRLLFDWATGHLKITRGA